MIEIQDIFKEHGTKYRKEHKLPLTYHKAMNSIERCRTSALGGHVDECDECGYTRVSYNSCRNRHCPKCQTIAKERWIESRKEDLLPVQYFHVVFTIPATINPVAFQNQKAVYNMLFRSVSETLFELASDKKYLGAKIGFTSIIHTWGSNLMHHPHAHIILPGGGLNKINKWVNSKKKFFIPVKVLSRKFRGKFLYYLKQAYYDKKLEFHGSIEYMNDVVAFEKLLSDCYEKEWVVYCKKPFRNAECVVEYLGRYTHRVAISNQRIVRLENGEVTFKWRDYKDKKKEKLMTVSAEEFIRRFLIHILPQRFVKIRHYGLLGSRNKKTKLKLCKKLTGAIFRVKKAEKLTNAEIMLKLVGRDITICPRCGSSKFTRRNTLSPPAS